MQRHLSNGSHLARATQLRPGRGLAGRNVTEQEMQRPATERAKRWLLKEGLTSPLFAPALKLGQLLRPILPNGLKKLVPVAVGSRAHEWPWPARPRKMLMPTGCVHRLLAPNINSATARVLDAAGIEVLTAWKGGCCGAIRSSLSDPDGALNDMRRNVDAWTPLLDRVEAIVMHDSGCGVMVKDYGKALEHDPRYAERAARVSALAKDLSELLPELVPLLQRRQAWNLTAHGEPPDSVLQRRMAFHAPCTMQGGQQPCAAVKSALRALGLDVSLPDGEAYPCRNWADTGSLLQRKASHQLRDLTLAQLKEKKPDLIICASLGCIWHLQVGTTIPVKHWVEVLDEALVCARTRPHEEHAVGL